MSQNKYIDFLVWALPKLSMRYRGFKKIKRQVCRRIDRRMGELGLSGLDEYKQYLIENKDEWNMLDQFCRIHISRFFRDARVFNTLTDPILPDMAQRLSNEKEKVLSVWSLGCSSGEEAYTFTIIWESLLKEKYPSLSMKIMATDSDEHMLNRAKTGVYQKSSLKELPEHLIEFGLDISGDDYIVKETIKRNVTFLNQDVRKEMPQDTFHIIACRNLVFTYYDFDLQKQLAQGLIDKLLPGGILVLGRNESLPDDFPEMIQIEQCKLLYKKV